MTTMTAVRRNHRGRLLTMLPTILEDGDHQTQLIGTKDTRMMFLGSDKSTFNDDVEEYVAVSGMCGLREEDQDGAMNSVSSSWNLFLGCTATVYLGLLVCIFSIAPEARFDKIQHSSVFGIPISPFSALDADNDTSTFIIHSPSDETFQADIESSTVSVASPELMYPSNLMSSLMTLNHTQSLHLRSLDDGVGSDLLDDEDNDPGRLTIYDSDEESDYHYTKSIGRERSVPLFHEE